MGRTRKAQVLQIEIPGETSEETSDKTAEEVESDAVMAESQSEMPKPPLTWLYRLDADSGEPAFIGKFAVGTLSESVIGKRWGGGRYRLLTRKPGPKGGYVFANQQTLTIDGAVQPEIREAPAVVPVSGLGAGSEFIEKLLLMQMQQSAQLMTAVMGAFAALRPAAPVGPDPVMLEIMRASLARKDPMELASAMVGMMKETGGAIPISPMEQLKQLLEIQQMLKGDGDGGGESDWISKGLNIAQTLIAQPGAARAVPDVLPPARQLAAAPVAHDAPTAPIPVEEIPMPSGLRPWITQVFPKLSLLLQASQFMPPEAAALTFQQQLESAGVWADVVADVQQEDANADTFPDAFVDRTMAALQVDATITQVGLVGDEAAAVRQWTRAVLEELALGIVEEDAIMQEAKKATDDLHKAGLE